jgi:ferredoxin
VHIKTSDLLGFLKRCVKEGIGPFKEIVLPARTSEKDSSPRLTRLEGEKDYVLDGFRPVDPLKTLLYLVREQVYPLTARPAPRMIAGIKACDLRALALLDQALINKDFVDPAYAAWRENTIIVSADCTAIAPTCHCTLTGGAPYSEAGFDLNLVWAGDRTLLEPGNDKGKALLELVRTYLPVETDDAGLRAEAAGRRARLVDDLKRQNGAFERSPDYSTLRRCEQAGWRKESAECIGCGACTHICPTCYCLILNDESNAGQFVKVRSYDSCQWQGYARVAGGATPRPKMTDRFRNRYLCKFIYMQGDFGRLGCTGCGRCTDACPAGIDFRSAVKNLLDRPAAGGAEVGHA